MGRDLRNIFNARAQGAACCGARLRLANLQHAISLSGCKTELAFGPVFTEPKQIHRRAENEPLRLNLVFAEKRPAAKPHGFLAPSKHGLHRATSTFERATHGFVSMLLALSD